MTFKIKKRLPLIRFSIKPTCPCSQKLDLKTDTDNSSKLFTCASVCYTTKYARCYSAKYVLNVRISRSTLQDCNRIVCSHMCGWSTYLFLHCWSAATPWGALMLPLHRWALQTVYPGLTHTGLPLLLALHSPHKSRAAAKRMDYVYFYRYWLHCFVHTRAGNK